MTLTPEMVEILPCPFCGEHAEFIQDTSEAYVECTNDMCGACSGNFGYHSGDQKAQALAAWNARAQSQRAVAVAEIEALIDKLCDSLGDPGWSADHDDATKAVIMQLRALIDRAGGG